MKLFVDGERIKPLSAYHKDLLQQVWHLVEQVDVLNEAIDHDIVSVKDAADIINENHSIIKSMVSVVIKKSVTADLLVEIELYKKNIKFNLKILT